MASAAIVPLPNPTTGQLNELAQVWEASVRATHSFLKEEDIQFFRPLVRNQYLKLVNLFAVFTADNKIAGFMGVAGDNLEMLFVRPDILGTGTGKNLLQYAIGHLGVTRVDVNEQNKQAAGFYHHFGFKVIARSETDALGKPFPVLHLQLSN